VMLPLVAFRANRRVVTVELAALCRLRCLRNRCLGLRADISFARGWGRDGKGQLR